jgi:hypothetical protein
VQFPDYYTELWSPGIRNGSRNHCDFSTYLAKRGKLSLKHAQKCSFLIMEQCCGTLEVEIFPGKHCNKGNSLAKRARAQSGACAEVQFPDYGTVLLTLAVEKFQESTAISAPILPRGRELGLEHAQR